MQELETRNSAEANRTNTAPEQLKGGHAITAKSVPAQSKRVRRLIQRRMEQQEQHQLDELDEKEYPWSPSTSTSKDAASAAMLNALQSFGGSTACNSRSHATLEKIEATSTPTSTWVCNVCSKRNRPGSSLCSTCGRPCGLRLSANAWSRSASMHPRALQKAAIHGHHQGGKGGSDSASGNMVAFGRRIASSKVNTASTSPGGKREPKKNMKMIAELQARMEERLRSQRKE